MSGPGTLAWFARHEARLAWRDWLAMMTAGRRRRLATVAVVLAVIAGFMHLVAFAVLGRYAMVGPEPGKAVLVVVTGSVLLSFFLLASQAVESVTRAFYARSDLDLILSSPTDARKVFAVRIGMMAVSVAAMAVLLASPFINVLAALGGARWLGAYAVAAAMGAVAVALAVAISVGLFRAIGPKRTRLIAQILAAVIGASFVIGLQVAAIVSYGTPSRMAVLGSDEVVSLAPAPDSIVWWPARAVLGDVPALAAMLALGLLSLGGCIAVFSAKFGAYATAAAGVAQSVVRQSAPARGYRRASAQQALRRKEWTLLKRDPWLVSQTLMQLLYLVPPAIMLWLGFGARADALVLAVPLLVMAAGQLAGGLAWLAISGEDAPDLVATAPIAAGQIVRAKVEAVMLAIAAVFAPFVAALAFGSVHVAMAAVAGIAVAAVSATQIQLWFRAQTKRSHFRRRQTSSRVATFAEAFSSIAWAATAALVAAGTWLAVIAAAFAVVVLFGARLMRPAAR